MQTIFINTIQNLNNAYESLFAPFDTYIEELGFYSWITGAIIDCVHMLPFLFIVFLFIEVIEFKYTNKIANIAQHSKITGPLIGSLAASFPQCGFSVIASTLYTQQYITMGTLIAIYIATSDEAVPIILADPTKVHLLLPLILTKILMAIVAGYTIDLVIKSEIQNNYENITSKNEEIGCCNHKLVTQTKKDLLIHPIKHTINIFLFIFIVTLGINYLVAISGGPDEIGKYFLNNSILQPIITAIIGLIPNCAVSVALTMLYIKGAISFGSVISGLSSGAGLGLLILFKKNRPISDSIKIILILLFISIISGLLIHIFCN